MNRLERITAILLLMQSRKKITAQQLAQKFDTSVRTIYRDVKVLEEAGVPIGAEAGFGYYIMEGYSLPPVMFTRDEAGAMLTAEKLLNRLGDVSLSNDFTSAMNRIRAVLRSSDKDYLEILEENISVHSRRPVVDLKEFPNKYLGMIQQAIVNQQVVDMEYYSNTSEETTRRKAEPIGLSFINGTWHLFAYCRLRNDVRDFRPDRIKKLTLTDLRYDKSKLPTLTQVAERFYFPKDHKKIVLQVSNSLAKYAGDMKNFMGIVSETKKKTSTEMVFLHHSINEFAKWILHWGDKVTVTEPEELKQEMKKLSAELMNHYL
jgi:predicted DNA-binding transcriptional regulator YafY